MDRIILRLIAVSLVFSLHVTVLNAAVYSSTQDVLQIDHAYDGVTNPIGSTCAASLYFQASHRNHQSPLGEIPLFCEKEEEDDDKVGDSVSELSSRHVIQLFFFTVDQICAVLDFSTGYSIPDAELAEHTVNNRCSLIQVFRL